MYRVSSRVVASLFIVVQGFGDVINLPTTAKGETTSNIEATEGEIDLDGGNRLEVHLVDVEQDDCILLLSYPTNAPSDRKAVLVDCGTSKWPLTINGKKQKQSEADERMLRVATHAKEYLNLVFENAPKRIDTLVISHPHGDHYSLAPFVLDGFEIGRVLLTGLSGHGSRAVEPTGILKNGAFQRWLKSDELEGKVESIEKGEHDRSANDFHWFSPDDYGALQIAILAANVGWTSTRAGDPQCSEYRAASQSRQF
jgi:hypothetical protein